LGAKWKELDDEEKKVYFYISLCVYLSQLTVSFQPYVEQAARDKERAEEAKTAYDVRLFSPFL
jgi:hypothetical protein